MLEMVTPKRFLITALLVFTVGTTAAKENRWQYAGAVSVPSNSARIVLVNQQGVDLTVRVQANGQTVMEQDGPDQAFGTEVLLLHNTDNQTLLYQLFVAPTLNGAPANFSIKTISQPTAAQQAIAERISANNQQWYRGSDAEPLLAKIKLLAEIKPIINGNDELGLIATDTYVDMLMRSGQVGEAGDFLREYLIRTQVGPIRAAYLRWSYAEALWQSLYLGQAFTEIEKASQLIIQSEFPKPFPEPTRRWLESKIKATLGAVRLIVGRSTGNNELMRKGGETIMAELLSLKDSADYSLRAQLTEYLASYYLLVLDRTNSLTTQLYQEAEALYEKAGNRLNIASIRNNEAYAELGRGNIASALRMYLETLELQQLSRHREGKAHVRARLGYLYFTLGDYRRAEIRYREAISIYEQLDLPRKLIHNQLEFAEVLRASGRNDEALASLQKLKSKYADTLSVEDTLRLSTQLGNNWMDIDNIANAEVEVMSSKNFITSKSDNSQELQSLTRLFYLLDLEILQARIEIERQDIQTAQSRITKALDSLGDTDREPLQQLQLLYLQMLIFQRQNNHPGFIDTGERALALIESIRSNVDFQTQGPAWSARTSHIKDLMVSHLLSRYEAVQDAESFQLAFSILQTTRAQNFREMRANVSSDAYQGDLEQATLAKASQNLVQAMLLDLPTEILEQKLTKAEEQYQIEKKQRERAQEKLAILTIDDIQNSITDDTQIRIFVVGEQKSFTIIIMRDFFWVVPLPGEHELADAIDKSFTELQNAQNDLTYTKQLANTLFPSGDDIPDASHILVEADGRLSAVPFSVLTDLQSRDEKQSSISYVESLSEYYLQSTSRNSQSNGIDRKDLVIFSDPAFALEAESTSRDLFDQWWSGLGRLQYTQIEAESVLPFFNDSKVSAFSGGNATIDNMLQNFVREAKILHIAAHGFASSTDPLLIGLALANDPSTGSSGLLTPNHINSLRFNNDLIIISTCDSANGQLLKGEGLMSISRAFLANGAMATISTLWPVSDRANAQFMKEFYFALMQLNLDSSSALVFAQQKLKEHRRFRHPYYWGPFVLHVADGSFKPTSY